jgi:hypothetical protein
VAAKPEDMAIDRKGHWEAVEDHVELAIYKVKYKQFQVSIMGSVLMGLVVLGFLFSSFLLHRNNPFGAQE